MNILSQSASGHAYWAREAEMHNLAGLLLRSGLPVGEAHLVSWGVWGLAMPLMAGWWRMRGGSPTPADIGVAVALATFVAPHLQLHDVALLLAPVLLLTLEVAGQTGIKRDVAMLIPVVASLILLTGLVASNGQAGATYAVMLLLTIGLLLVDRKAHAEDQRRGQTIPGSPMESVP